MKADDNLATAGDGIMVYSIENKHTQGRMMPSKLIQRSFLLHNFFAFPPHLSQLPEGTKQLPAPEEDTIATLFLIIITLVLFTILL